METTKKCSFCANPLHLIMLGHRRSRVWVHKGAELECCTAIKLSKDLMQSLQTVLENISKVSPVKVARKDNGEPVIFGERRAEQS